VLEKSLELWNSIQPCRQSISPVRPRSLRRGYWPRLCDVGVPFAASDCEIGNEGVAFVAKAIRDGATIRRCVLQGDDVCVLCPCFFSLLPTLSLVAGNNIGCEGGLALADALNYSQHLCKLYLSGTLPFLCWKTNEKNEKLFDVVEQLWCSAN